MTLEELEQIIGKIWYIRDRFDVISKHKGVLDRAESVEGIVSIVAKYDPGKKKFTERLVLDNYLGALQHLRARVGQFEKSNIQVFLSLEH